MFEGYSDSFSFIYTWQLLLNLSGDELTKVVFIFSEILTGRCDKPGG
jgi:hypothetical protein